MVLINLKFQILMEGIPQSKDIKLGIEVVQQNLITFPAQTCLSHVLPSNENNQPSLRRLAYKKNQSKSREKLNCLTKTCRIQQKEKYRQLQSRNQVNIEV